MNLVSCVDACSVFRWEPDFFSSLLLCLSSLSLILFSLGVKNHFEAQEFKAEMSTTPAKAESIHWYVRFILFCIFIFLLFFGFGIFMGRQFPNRDKYGCECHSVDNCEEYFIHLA